MLLRLWPCLLGGELLALSCSLLLFFLLAALALLLLLLSLFLLLLLGLLALLVLLLEWDLEDGESDMECELFRSDAGELRLLPLGVLDPAFLETSGGTVSGTVSAVVSSAADKGGPGGC